MVYENKDCKFYAVLNKVFKELMAQEAFPLCIAIYIALTSFDLIYETFKMWIIFFSW